MDAATKVGVVGLGEAARRPGTILCDGTQADKDTWLLDETWGGATSSCGGGGSPQE